MNPKCEPNSEQELMRLPQENERKKARLVAYYLPQFHPTAENDAWWGKGFTEWTNVGQSRPLFSGHFQPRVPADLGYYDLRVPEVREAQARLARDAGIEGFCYWHYWFAGHRLLERPFNEVLRSGAPDFPFCLAWANETWSGVWHGSPRRTLVEQTYPGPEDHERHFHALLPAFHDRRYIRMHGKPVFVVYRPQALPHLAAFIEQWQTLAALNGLGGIYFIAHVFAGESVSYCLENGFSGAAINSALKIARISTRDIARRRWSLINASNGRWTAPWERIEIAAHACWLYGWEAYRRLAGQPLYVFNYEDAMLFFLDGFVRRNDCYPSVVSNWDNSPRAGLGSIILHNSKPAAFQVHLRDAMRLVEDRPYEDRLIFVKSWNEWAEGNYLEPDQKFGHQYLDVIRNEVLGAD
jgi:hypothetical protein